MRQNAKTSVEKDFYKLMNNSNVGYDSRNNTDNYSFTALFYKIKELTFAEKYQILFDRNISEFVSSELLKRQIEEEFANKLAALDSHLVTCQKKKKKKNNNNVTPTTCFFSGKILVFAKISLISFISDILKTFCLQVKKQKKFSKMHG